MSNSDSHNNEMRDMVDKLDSLHHRMDSFYSWAAVLQKEFRNLSHRVQLLESKLVSGLDPPPPPSMHVNAENDLEASLLLNRLRTLKNEHVVSV